MRTPRLLAAVAVTVTVLVTGAVAAGPALAAGTGGIEVTPIPSFDAGGRLLTSFHLAPHGGHAKGAFELRNLTDAPDSARLYGAQATESADGAVAIGDASSGSWLGVPSETFTLAPHETRMVSFTADTSAQHRLGAVVVEVAHGTIVTRAATLVTIAGGAGLTAAGVATWLACLAAGLALLIGAGHGWRLRRVRQAARRPETVAPVKPRSLQPV